MKPLVQLYRNKCLLAGFGESIFLLALFLSLNACTSTPMREPGLGNKEAYQLRVSELNTISKWGFVGKISLDDGDQGGSGKLQWAVEPGNSELDFHAAMGRGAWHLQIGPDQAVLKEANGAEQSAAGVNALIQDRMGWPIPVDALQWWVRGMAAPGAIEEEEFDSEGLMLSLQQFGWRVEFRRYVATSGLLLPKRLDARQDNYRVKLAVSRWQLGVDHALNN